MSRVSQQRRTVRSHAGWIAALLALCGGLATMPAARGAVIAYQFGGVITSADPATGVAPGTPFTGTFSYDPSTSGGAIGYDGMGQVAYGGPVWGLGHPASGDTFRLQIGGQTVVQESGALGTVADTLEYAGQYGDRGPDGPMPAHTTLTVSTGDASSPFASLRLSNPTTYVPLFFNQNGGPNLGLFPDATLSVARSMSSSATLYQGTLTSLSTIPDPVPEPGLTPLVVGAAAWLAGSGRRRARG
jgi:hypothetical protein